MIVTTDPNRIRIPQYRLRNPRIHDIDRVTTLGEPRLGIRNLYPDLQRKEISDDVVPILNLLAYADGDRDLIGLCDIAKVPFDKAIALLQALHREGLIEKVTQ